MTLAVLDLDRAIEFSQRDLSNGTYDPGELELLRYINERRETIAAEQQEFVAACERWDGLYYPGSNGILQNGASHWAWHSSAKVPGKAHVSLNTPPIYVDIPAALQAVSPIENLVPLIDSDEARSLAAMCERLYAAWRGEVDLNLLGHKACVVKGLYGRTAAKVYWDAEVGFPRIEIVDQPRNLWLGWGQSDYRSLDWAAYSYLMTAEAVFAEYGLVCVPQQGADGNEYPYLMPYSNFNSWADARQMMWTHGYIEVTDYWYRAPRSHKSPKVGARLKAVKHDTWNAIIVGNRIVQNMKFSEYDGMIPYVPLFNSYIPGIPNGRPELFDIEALIHEKDQQLSNGSQMLHNIVNAQYWQLTGPDAPSSVPVGVKPKANQVIAPGAGNRIEGIQPWAPEFQLEQFLTRIDREMVDVSGLNDLLRGLAPASVMSSSKAINALVANYETRISMKRDLYYRWRRDLWELARNVWANKARDLEGVLKGSGRLDIVSPSLTPRDDMETAQIARTLVDGKLWSAIRGMDRVGVDDPEAEQNIIRGEQSDVSLNPAAVQVMAATASTLQSLGFANAQQATEAIAGPQANEGGEVAANMNDLRSMMGAAAGVVGSGEQPIPAQEAIPGNVEGGPPGAGTVPMGPPGAVPAEGQGSVLAQTMIKGGEASNRLMLQQELGGAPPPEA